MGILILDECVQCKTNYMLQKNIKNIHKLDYQKSVLFGVVKLKAVIKNEFLFEQSNYPLHTPNSNQDLLQFVVLKSNFTPVRHSIKLVSKPLKIKNSYPACR